MKYKLGNLQSAVTCFAAAGKTNKFLEFKVILIRLPMFLHSVYFSIGQCSPLPYATVTGPNSEIGTCRVNILSSNYLSEALFSWAFN